ncbi:helix-turn-helix domain-containing protein [Nocardia sp. CA-135953]|uniref:helix-turn-helix domain-containing protein n=1 Tax=Nocardia sp. CA-135953 TaxID=3239978 RepID=UPI003D960643
MRPAPTTPECPQDGWALGPSVARKSPSRRAETSTARLQIGLRSTHGTDGGDLQPDIGERLRATRQAAGRSLAELAARIPFSRSYLGHIGGVPRVHPLVASCRPTDAGRRVTCRIKQRNSAKAGLNQPVESGSGELRSNLS